MCITTTARPAAVSKVLPHQLSWSRIQTGNQVTRLLGFNLAPPLLSFIVGMRQEVQCAQYLLCHREASNYLWHRGWASLCPAGTHMVARGKGYGLLGLGEAMALFPHGLCCSRPAGPRPQAFPVPGQVQESKATQSSRQIIHLRYRATQTFLNFLCFQEKDAVRR